MNMADPIRLYNIITLRPHWAQYIISQEMSFIISCALFLVAGHDSITYKMPFVVLGGVMTCIMLYRCLYLYKLRYIITSEQLIIQHGVRTRTIDYIELYRVGEFSENRDMLAQVLGLKTVWVCSGDRSKPRLDSYGVRERLDGVRIIRERVEYNKKRKGIYEITNR